MKTKEILKKMNIFVKPTAVTPFVNAEDGEKYQVWLVIADDKKYVLKKAKGYETELYMTLLSNLERAVPKLIAMTDYEGETFLLTEYVEGLDIRYADREKIIKCLDALIYLQEKFWNYNEASGLSFEAAFESRINRGKYLGDSDIERIYSEYISIYQQLPRTLCHDDLLPFNLIVGEKDAYLIDWEYGGILPYPSSIARLISHCEEDENAFFFMKDEDKQFALDYYYNQFIMHKKISREEYDRIIDLFILYEYCEWIMLGNKYSTADMTRYKIYLEKARRHIDKM